MERVFKTITVILLSAICTVVVIDASSQERRSKYANLKDTEIPSDIHREYYLKGAFLRYVSRMLVWPEENTNEFDINVCVYGDIDSKKGLNSLNGRVVESKIITVRYLQDYKIALEPKACQFLFVSKYKDNEYDQIISDLKGKPVLTFGDGEGFADKGGGMNFYIVNNRMAIMINTMTAHESGIMISPRMLRLVTVIPNAQDLRDDSEQEKEQQSN